MSSAVLETYNLICILYPSKMLSYHFHINAIISNLSVNWLIFKSLEYVMNFIKAHHVQLSKCFWKMGGDSGDEKFLG